MNSIDTKYKEMLYYLNEFWNYTLETLEKHRFQWIFLVSFRLLYILVIVIDKFHELNLSFKLNT